MLRFATFLAPRLERTYAWIARAVGARLGTDTELHVGTDYAELPEGRADVAFLCGLPYVHLADAPVPTVTPIAAPVLDGERYGGRPIYFSDVIVRDDARFRTFDDLRGASWAFNERDSQSGFGVVRAHLARRGERGAYFARVVEAGFHDTAMRLVAAGAVDAAAIDSQVLAIALRDEPDLAAALRVVEVMGPSTIQPVVASTRLDAGLRSALQEAFVQLEVEPGGAETLAAGLVKRFTIVGDEDYDDIRAMEREADAAGLVGLGTPPESLARR